MSVRGTSSAGPRSPDMYPSLRSANKTHNPAHKTSLEREFNIAQDSFEHQVLSPPPVSRN